MEPKEVLFDAISFRPNYAIRSFYYNQTTFERVDANREFYEGDVVHVTDVFGTESDPGGLIWEVQGRNSENVLYHVCVQPMAMDWGRRDGQVIPQVISPNAGPGLDLDPNDYMGWLFAVRPEGVEVWPTEGKGTPYITIVPQGYSFKQINQPNFAEIEWAGHTAFVEMNYVAPQLKTGTYYMQLAEIDWDPIQDPEWEPAKPPPDEDPWWMKVAQWLYQYPILRWLGDLIVWIFNR